MRYLQILLVCCTFTLAGCSMGELKTAATERDPATGKTPPEEVVESVTSILDFPLNLGEWGDLIGNLVILTAAGFGYKEWRKFRKNGTVKDPPK